MYGILSYLLLSVLQRVLVALTLFSLFFAESVYRIVTFLKYIMHQYVIMKLHDMIYALQNVYKNWQCPVVFILKFTKALKLFSG